MQTSLKMASVSYFSQLNVMNDVIDHDLKYSCIVYLLISLVWMAMLQLVTAGFHQTVVLSCNTMQTAF